MPDHLSGDFGRVPARIIRFGVIACVMVAAGLPASGEEVFPGATWATRTPAEAGMDQAKLNQIASTMGGKGCVVRDGYMVKTWGSQSGTGEHWASASKPVFSTLLFFAIEEGRLSGVHATLAGRGWAMSAKDAPMEFHHVANMISGYARGEVPGAAWAYNDYGIQLFWKSLFTGGSGTRTSAFGQDGNTVAYSRLVVPLQMQDGAVFDSGMLVVSSVRDFARIGWWWMHKGNWNGTQLLPQHYFDDYMKPHVPAGLPRTAASGGDYLGIGTYGGGSDQTPYGPGVYGYTWWFNPGHAVWPDAPEDTVQANGLWNSDTVTMIPSLRVLMACKAANTPSWGPGDPNSGMNQILKLLTESVSPETPLIALSTSQINRVVDLHENPASDTFTVTNTGTSTLQYAISASFAPGDPPWFAVDPATGSSTGEADIVTVSYAIDGLAAGTYSAAIQVSDNGSTPPAANSPRSIAVTLEVKSVLPDHDGDGDVDVTDFGFLQTCFTSAADTITPRCLPADMNDDNLVDQNDFNAFLSCLSGANIPADRTCDDAYE